MEAVEMPEAEQYSPKAEVRAKRERRAKAKAKKRRKKMRKGTTEGQEGD